MINTRKITRTSLLVTVAVLLGYVESTFPPVVPVAGIKLGLANTIIIIELYTAQIRQTWLVALLKVFLCTVLFGSVTSFIYSLCGAVISLIVMIFAKRTGFFSLIGVSSLGGIFHNLAQLVCAYFFIGKGALFHIPVLCLSGALCGVLTGVAAQILIKRGGALFEEE